MRIFDDKRCDDTIRLAIDRELGGIQLDASQKSAILAQCRPSLTVAPTIGRCAVCWRWRQALPQSWF